MGGKVEERKNKNGVVVGRKVGSFGQELPTFLPAT